MDKKPIAAGKSSFDLVDRDIVFGELALGKDSVMLDVAGGAGNYTLAAAEIITGDGRVYAFDLWQEGIDELNRRIAERSGGGQGNITAAVADVTREIPLPAGSVDVALIATALHDLVEEGGGEATLREVARVLKPDGKLVIVEFRKIEGPPGPPARVRLSPEELDALVLPAGFEKLRTVDAGPYTYVSTYSPADSL